MKFVHVAAITLAAIATCRAASSKEEMVKPYYIHSIDHEKAEKELGIVSKNAKTQPMVSVSPTTDPTPIRDRSNVVIGSSLLAILTLAVIAFAATKVRRGSKGV